MIIAVGSTNKAKIQSVEKAVASIQKAKGIPSEFSNLVIIKGVDCSSGISNQPLDEESTIQGALNRARTALRTCQDSSYGIGIESGVSRIGDRYFEGGFVVIVSKNFPDNIGISSSNRYELRENIMKQLSQGQELSTAVESLTGVGNIKSTLGMSGVISNGIIDRAESYVNAVILAFGCFVSNKELW